MAEVGKDERRRAPRRTLIDTVQVTEVQEGTRSKARTADISLTGCYIETMNPPPVGTHIRLRLTLRGMNFEASATVVRCEANMGMAVRFDELAPAMLAVLEKWLADSA